MTKQEIQDKIAEKEKRILELQQIYGRDVAESFREATQTQDMIIMYQHQVDRLKQDLKNAK